MDSAPSSSNCEPRHIIYFHTKPINSLLSNATSATFSSSTNVRNGPGVRATLTFKNGFYTIQSAKVPKGTEPVAASSVAVTSSLYDANGDMSLGSALTKRQELNQVQLELKRNLHLYQINQQKVSVYESGGNLAPEENFQLKNAQKEMKECEERIAKLKEQQARCIKAAREGLLAQNADITQQAIISRFKATKNSSEQRHNTRKLVPEKHLPVAATPSTSAPKENISSPAASAVSLAPRENNSTPAAVPIAATASTVTSAAVPSLTIPSVTSPSVEVLRIKTEKVEPCDVEVEIIQLTESAPSADNQPSSNKPHLLSKPLPVSPVPTSLDAQETQYSSIQQSHMSDIQSSMDNTDDEEKQQSIQFMAALDLVTPQTLEHLNKSRGVRQSRQRSASNKIIDGLLNDMNPSIYGSTSIALRKRPRRSARNDLTPSPPPELDIKRAKLSKSTGKNSVSSSAAAQAASSDSSSTHEDYCSLCAKGGQLLLCDSCPLVYHLQCVGLKTIPTGVWNCPKCTKLKQPKTVSNPSRGNNSVINAVQDYVDCKQNENAVKSGLLKTNANLVAKTQKLTAELKKLNSDLEEKMKENADLKDVNQETRNSLIKIIDIMRSIRSRTQQLAKSTS